MYAFIAILLQAVATPIIYNEPADPGRIVTRDDAIGMCASNDPDAIVEMDAMLKSGRPGACQALEGVWHVSRRIADRCIGEMPGWYFDEKGRKNPSVSCMVEAHAVEIRQDTQVRFAVIVLHADQLQ